MTKHQKNGIKIGIAAILLLAAMIALAISLGGCMIFKTLTINLEHDSSQIK